MANNINLPEGYQRIEYLQSSGEQWIDTGIVQNSLNYEFTLVLQWVGDAIAAQEVFAGFMKSPQYPRNFVQKYNGQWMAGTNSTSNDFGDGVDQNVHTVTLSCTDTTETITLDGSVVKTYTVAATGLADNTLPFFLFARNNGGNALYLAKCRIMGYSYKEYVDSTRQSVVKSCDLIPVRVGTTGYMYDTVSGELFENAGTGEFILGPDTASSFGEGFLNYTGLKRLISWIKGALNVKQDILTFDSAPTSSSSNPVTSGGVYTALQDKQDVSPITNAASGALTVNEYRDFGSVSALTVTLTGGTMANYDLYKFAFTCASNSTTLTLPSDVKLPVDMEMEMATGRRFECVIDYANCLTFNCWD